MEAKTNQAGWRRRAYFWIFPSDCISWIRVLPKPSQRHIRQLNADRNFAMDAEDFGPKVIFG
jgi:hypothetical protein